MDLRQKTVSGFIWSFIDNFSKLGITFLIGIILARLLTPREYGLIGMLSIFIAISQVFIDFGFTEALIRKKECSQADYSTVFYFNLVVGIILYLVLFLTASYVSSFFNEPQLKLIIRIIGLGLIIESLTIVQRTDLTKRIDFKLQTKISMIASTISGIIGIVMAFTGFGVWSLVYKSLTGIAITSFLLWIWNKWKPSLEFSKDSFREMFSFGSKLLVSGVINTIYRNIYLLIIGKYFSAAELGFYTRAEQFTNLPSTNINNIVQRVSYPVLSTIQDDIPKLKMVYKRLIKNTMLISFISMIGLAAIAKPLVLTLIGAKWLQSAVYIQLLAFVGMLYPLHSLNLNMLNVLGRSDLFLKLELIKKALAVPTIIIGIYFGIKVMLLGMIFNSLVAYYLNSFWSGRFIGYPVIEQIVDIFPSFLLAIFVGTGVFCIGFIITTSSLMTLILQIIVGAILTITAAEILKFESYFEIKGIILEKFCKGQKKLWNTRN